MPALYFDIETVPDYSRLDSFGLDPVPTYTETDMSAHDPTGVASWTVDTTKELLKANTPPASWIDAAEAAEVGGKRRAGVLDLLTKARGARKAVVDAAEQRRKLLSITPEYCRIAAIGWAVGDGDPEAVVVPDPDKEADALDKFWGLVAIHTPIIGFNIIAFDLPVIFVRSALLQVTPTRSMDLKAWGKDVVDVYALRFGSRGNGGAPGKLKELAKLMGIVAPAGDVDGSQVEGLLKTDPEKVRTYCASDVSVTRDYHRCFQGLFWL